MAQLSAVYRHAVRARLLDERLSMLARAHRIGMHPDAQRAEIVIVAATLALDTDDWIFPTPRDHAAALTRGVTMERYAHHALGTAADAYGGRPSPGLFASREHRIGSPGSLLSQHLTQATGFAWAAKMRGQRDAVLTFLPETAAEAGDFHSAVNFAGVNKAPIVFLVKTDGDESPAAPVEVVDKGIAYGVESVSVSADPEVVADAVKAALGRAREGAGPTLLEVRISTEPDPLVLLGRDLVASGAMSELDDITLRRQVMGEIEAAIAAASAMGPPERGSLFEGVFASLPPHLIRQRDELAAAPLAPALPIASANPQD